MEKNGVPILFVNFCLFFFCLFLCGRLSLLGALHTTQHRFPLAPFSRIPNLLRYANATRDDLRKKNSDNGDKASSGGKIMAECV